MLSDGDVVVCGLSGGADSVCLLLSMIKISKRMNISVEALHINHCLRGSESDRDEQFCRELCGKLGVTFNAVSCNVSEYAEKHSLSTEEAAREMRYAQFDEFSHGKKIATAHNANDNLETVILNLSRGTALKGLAGIPPIRNNIVRPLLVCSRKEIEEYLNSHSQNWVTDSTNLSDDYTRNKIRHGILPIMQEINQSVIETSVRSISAVRSEELFIETEVNSALDKCRNGNVMTGLREYSAVIRRRCIAKLLSDNSLPYSFKRLEETDNILLNGGKINISGENFLISDGNKIELSVITQNTNNLRKTELKIGENSIFDGISLFCELVNCEDLAKNDSVNNLLTFYLLDCDKIKGTAVLRSRIFGDRIMLSGRSFTSSVKKLINEKVPASQRGTLHFIEDDEGTIFAESIGISQRVAPDSETTHLLRICIRKK